MADGFPVQHAYLIPLLPMVAAAVVLLLGSKVLRQQSHWPVWLGVGGSAVLSLWMLLAMWANVPAETRDVSRLSDFTLARHLELWTWFDVDGLRASVGFWLDPLTAVMLSVVTGIGFLITVFSVGYMKGEVGYWRFFAGIGLFIFAMTVLVMADNLVLLFLGWEGVGLASYLLIGFYSDTVAARDAARKAFVINRIGDAALAVAVILIYQLFGTVSFFGTPEQPGFLQQAMLVAGGLRELSGWEATAFAWIPYLLLLGCFGKSAQWPLFTWLPDAMAGPTPVSALIHAATMVTAGVYLVVRCGPLFYGFDDVLVVLGVIACFTAVFAGTISLRQYDLKKDFAYSTVSQLGFMFVAAAALAPVAAIFHLVTHAFFKALLFLGSGVIMHATHGELDMRKMSGLKRFLPMTRWLMLIGCAALAGLPLLSGYFSKDEILVNSFRHSALLGTMMLLSAAMTAYYTFRLYFRVFEGEEIIPHGAADHGGGHGAAVSVSKAATARLDRHVDEWEKPAAGAGPHGASAGPGHGQHGEAQHGEAQHGEARYQPGMTPPPDVPVVDEHAAHGGHHGGPREPMVMILPLVLLAVGSVVAGFLNFPHRDTWSLGALLGQSPSFAWGLTVANVTFEGVVPPDAFGLPKSIAGVEAKEAFPHWVMFVVSGLVAVAGVGLAYQFHLRDRESLGRLSRMLPSVVRVLEAKYWVDELYDLVFVRPLWLLARVLDVVDLVLSAAVWVVGYVPKAAAFGVSLATQRGMLQGYAVAMLIGLAVVLVLVFRG
ncbi:MAG: NADH-quinone oxidoreductase subunit L [Tepidisphaerales bacterium]